MNVDSHNLVMLKNICLVPIEAGILYMPWSKKPQIILSIQYIIILLTLIIQCNLCTHSSVCDLNSRFSFPYEWMKTQFLHCQVQDGHCLCWFLHEMSLHLDSPIVWIQKHYLWCSIYTETWVRTKILHGDGGVRFSVL